MDFTQILGFLAAILTTCSFVAQAVKVIQTKNTEGISLVMYVMFVIGVFFWLVYGFITKQWSVTIANAITLCFSSIILVYTIRNTFRKA